MNNYIETENLKKRAVAYARFSSDMQREESIDAQLRAIIAYATLNGYEIVSNFIDKAKSGMSDKRDEFQKMIDEAERGKFDAIIVHKLDRFSRNRYDSINYKVKLRNNNIRVISVTEKIDDTPEGELLEGMIETVNQLYCKNLARETLKGLKENAYKCLSTGGRPALGYNFDQNKKLIINEKEAHSVRLIFDMYLGNYSYPKIINKLNELGYKTKKNNFFGKNSIYDILKNERYMGVYCYNKIQKMALNGKRNSHKYKKEDEIIRIENGCPAIISKETFKLAQEKLKTRSIKYKSKHEKFQFSLSSKIKCNECGSVYCGLSKQRKKRENLYYNYYACSNKNYIEKCNNKLIRQEFIEEEIYNNIILKIKGDISFKKIVNDIIIYIENELNNQNEIIEKLKNIEIKINNLVNLISEYKNISLIEKLTILENEKYELENKMFYFNDIDITKEKEKVITKLKEIQSLDKTDILKEHIKSVIVGIDFVKAEVIVFDDYIFNIEFKRDVK